MNTATPSTVAAMLASWQEKAKHLPAVVPECATCEDAKFLFDANGNRRGRCPDCNRPVTVGLPDALQRVRLADVRPLPGNRLALERARAFIDDGPTDLFLFGAVGTGKTFCAAAIGNEVCVRKGHPIVRFVRWPLTLHRLSPGHLPDDERLQLEAQLFESKVLIIDDLGAERDMATDFTRRTAYIVFEERGDRGLRTIITSNLSLDQLAQHFGDDRLTSRIAGRADVVLIEGEDQRLRPAAEDTNHV